MIYNEIERWLQFASMHPHEFTIQYPPAPEYFKNNFKEKPQNPIDVFGKHGELLLYLHIPFCKHKCSYCNFAVEISNNRFEAYTNALCKEIDLYLEVIRNNYITGIDIGGGTPTLLPTHLLCKILEKIAFLTQDNSDPNFISIETTPHIAATEFDKLKSIANANVKRISIGVQSNIDNILTSVKRKKEIGQNEKAIENINQAGFERLNIDLIFGVPSQTEENWVHDLNHAISLNPTSITTYDCLYSRKGRNFSKSIKLPSLNYYGKLYDIGFNILNEHGYCAEYGSVNFSKISNETGTSQYFERRLLDGKSYLGLGNYSTSLNGKVWYFNVPATREYIDQVSFSEPAIGDYYVLPDQEMMAKYILSSLNYGIIDCEKFNKRFQCDFEIAFGEQLEFALSCDWIEKKQNHWKLKEGEFKNMNFFRSLFYSEKAQKWMMSR